MLDIEPLRIGPWGELLEQLAVIWSWIVVQEPVLLLGGELQIEPKCREPGWARKRANSRFSQLSLWPNFSSW